MKGILGYGVKILIAIDQLINTLFLGDPDETISSRAFRKHKRSRVWNSVKIFIDLLLFFDKVETPYQTIHHCELSFLFYVKRRQSTFMTYQEDLDETLHLVKDRSPLF